MVCLCSCPLFKAATTGLPRRITVRSTVDLTQAWCSATLAGRPTGGFRLVFRAESLTTNDGPFVATIGLVDLPSVFG